MKIKKQIKKSGFTLIEGLICIIIVASLSLAGFFGYIVIKFLIANT